MLRKLFGKRIEEILRKYSKRGVRLEGDATFFGLESRSVTQIRGNGILLLTDADLVFGMFRPARDVVIPLPNIVKIELAESHLAKTAFQPLLKVYFTDETGHVDSAAWRLANPAQWKARLDRRCA
jgi:hypothetical protein